MVGGLVTDNVDDARPGATRVVQVCQPVCEAVAAMQQCCRRLAGDPVVAVCGLDGAVIVIRDYEAYLAARPDGTTPSPVAGDDAADVRWVGEAEAAAMDSRGELTGGLLTALRSWR